MAIYHLSIKIISRGKGKSAVAAAAYRAGEAIKSEYDGIVNDYTRKGGVVHTEILLSGNAPVEYAERAALWNAVEVGERNKNAQLAREIELALPVELTLAQNRELVRQYCQQHFVDKGMCADISLHDKNDGNPHAHIMLTVRPISPDGTWGVKSKKEYVLDENDERVRLKNGEFKTYKVSTVDWNEPTKAEEWRAAWANAVNATLERQGFGQRIDHRSFARQGKEEIPTVHLGASATQMERRGIATQRGNLNRGIAIFNSKLQQLNAKIGALQNWLKEETAKAEPLTLADVLQNIIARHEQKQITSLYQAKNNSNMLIEMRDYLIDNSIADMAGLQDKIGQLSSERSALGHKLNQLDRSWRALDEHLKQVDIYHEHKEIYTQYKAIKKPKKQEKFYEEHRREITLYEAARRHLNGVMDGKTALPVTAWKAERDKLYAKYNSLGRDYAALKGEAREIEQMRRGLEHILREENRRAQPQQERPQRSRGMDR